AWVGGQDLVVTQRAVAVFARSCSTSLRRRILPEADFGISSIASTNRTFLCGATRAATNCISSSGAAADLRTTNDLRTSPAASAERGAGCDGDHPALGAGYHRADGADLGPIQVVANAMGDRAGLGHPIALVHFAVEAAGARLGELLVEGCGAGEYQGNRRQVELVDQGMLGERDA